MRWTLLMVCCACGRFGFDTGGSSDNNTIDAPVSVIDAPKLALDAGQCPPSYTFVVTSCCRESIANAGWLPGELACEADAVGAHLAVIDDAGEYARFQTTYGTSLRTWIGLSRRTTSAYRTVIDTDGFRDLTSSQTETSEDCVALDNTAHMGTHSCSDSNRYICEYDGRAAVPGSY